MTFHKCQPWLEDVSDSRVISIPERSRSYLEIKGHGHFDLVQDKTFLICEGFQNNLLETATMMKQWVMFEIQTHTSKVKVTLG